MPVRLVIEIFLWAGVNPNWRDRLGNNALHSALQAALDGVKNQKSPEYMLNINQIIRVLIEKKVDKHGLPEQHLEYLAKIQPEERTVTASDWERTRPVPIFDSVAALAKWKAVSHKFHLCFTFCFDRLR